MLNFEYDGYIIELNSLCINKEIITVSIHDKDLYNSNEASCYFEFDCGIKNFNKELDLHIKRINEDI